MRTATPNDVYTQQGAKPACQEDTNAKFSHLLLAQLPRTQFTHSKLPNPHARKTPMQNFRTSYWHSYPEHSLHTASCQTRPQRKIFAPPIGRATPNDVYTQQSHLHTASCQTLSRGSEYCACQTDSSRGPRRPGAPQPFLEAPSTAPATQTGAAAHGDQAQVLRLPHRQEPRPTATRRAATLSGGSKYCACHTDRTRLPHRQDPQDQARHNPFWRLQVPDTQHPRPTATRRNPFWRLQVLRLPHRQEPRPRPGAPQPFLEAPSTAPATQTGATAHGDQARRNSSWRLQVLRLPHRQEPRPTATSRAATLSGGSKYCACHTDKSRGPRRAATLSGGSKYCACHTDRSRGPRRPGAPQPFLEAPCHTDKSRGPRRPGAPQPFVEAPSTAPATRTGAAAHGDQARRNPF